jgi:O-antigen/teichoic acid export membrane protein
MMWMALSIGATKVASFAAQIVLGWLLSRNDFGLYAMAISAGAVANMFRHGGTQQILIQRGGEYTQLARPIFQMALLFNTVSAVLLASAATLLEGFYRAPGLKSLIWVVSISMVLSTLGSQQLTKLSIDLRFRTVSVVSTLSALVRYASTIAFALSGFGPMSFVLPLILVAIFEACAGWMLVGRLPAGPGLTWQRFKELFDAAKWVILGALAIAMTLQGDYLTVGRLESAEVLGLYFFAFQLTTSVATLFTTGLASVLTPSLTKLNHDAPRQSRAYLRAIKILAFISAPACIGLAIIVEPVVKIVWWDHKWDAAIPAVQLLAISLTVRLLAPLGMSLMESRGRWRWRGALLFVDGIATIAAAALGSWIGGLIAIVICVCIERVIMGIVECVVAGRFIDVPMIPILRGAGVPILISLICAGAVYLLSPLQIALPSWCVLLVNGGLFTFLIIFMSWVTMRHSFRDAVALIRRKPV